MCKQSANTQTVVQNPTIPDWLSNQFQSLATRAQGVSDRPYNPGVQKNVADFTPDQLQSFQQVRQDQGNYQPYMDAATGYAQIGGSPISAGQIANYSNPFQSQVIDATMANINQNNAIQANNLRGNAALQGGLGNDRLGVAQAELARNQNLATNQTLATLNAQNFNQALGAAQGDRTAAQQAASQFANLGGNMQSMANRDAAALLQTGGLQQGLAQQQLDTTSGNIAQQEQYPFATASWLGGMLQGASPSFTGSQQTSTTPGPSALSQIAGLGMLGYGLMGSDPRMKIDMGVVGKLNDGTPVHAYKYKDDPEGQTHFGPMADDVAKTNPEAVYDIDGMLYVKPDEIIEHQQEIIDGEYEDVTEREGFNSGGYTVGGTYSVDKNNIIRMSGGNQPGQATPYGASNTVPQQSMTAGAMLQAAPIKKLPAPKSRAKEMYDDASDIADDMRGMQQAGQGLAGMADQGMRGLGGVSMKPFSNYGPPVPEGLADGGRVGYFTGGLAGFGSFRGAQEAGMPTPYGASNIVPTAPQPQARPVAGLGAAPMPAVPMDAQDGPGINPTMGLGAAAGSFRGAQEAGMPSDGGQTVAGAQGSDSLTGGGGLFGPMSDPARQGVIQAGLGMLAGTSPHAMVNIGRGGQMGFAAYNQALSAEQAKAQRAADEAHRKTLLDMRISEFKAEQAVREAEAQRRAAREPFEMDKLRRGAMTPEQIAAEREALADKYKLSGDARTRFIMTGELQSGTGGKVGLNPIYGVDKDGNPVVMQPTDSGKVIASEMPDGVRISREPIKMDAGTHFVLMDPVTRQVIGQIPKNNQQEAQDKARGKELGEAQGKSIVDLPKVESLTDRLIADIESVSTDPNLGNVTGWQARFPTMFSKNIDTEEKAMQLSSRAFLMAFESLKGAGAITEVEGKTATRALARLENLKQSDEGYKQALEDFKREVMALRDVARRKAAAGGGSAPAPAGGGGSGVWSAQRVN